jgi:hypothetical protein
MKIEKQFERDGLMNSRISCKLKALNSKKKRFDYITMLYQRKEILVKLNGLCQKQRQKCPFDLNVEFRNLDLVRPNLIQAEIDKRTPPVRVKKITIDRSNVIHLRGATTGKNLQSYLSQKPKALLSRKAKARQDDRMPWNPIISTGMTR